MTCDSKAIVVKVESDGSIRLLGSDAMIGLLMQTTEFDDLERASSVLDRDMCQIELMKVEKQIVAVSDQIATIESRKLFIDIELKLVAADAVAGLTMLPITIAEHYIEKEAKKKDKKLRKKLAKYKHELFTANATLSVLNGYKSLLTLLA